MQGNADVDHAIQQGKLRYCVTAKNHITQAEALHDMGLLGEKHVASGNYLNMGSPRQQQALNELATAYGTTWMDIRTMRRSGIQCSGSLSGKKLCYVTVSRDRLRTPRLLSDCAPTAHRLCTNR